VIRNNTTYQNRFNGILVGFGKGSSPCARVEYNITQSDNKGVQLGSNSTVARSLPGYTAAYNVIAAGNYGAGTPRPDSDLTLSPRLVDPDGDDEILGGDGFADDLLFISQRAAGQSSDSPPSTMRRSAPKKADSTSVRRAPAEIRTAVRSTSVSTIRAAAWSRSTARSRFSPKRSTRSFATNRFCSATATTTE
jgi:hypothetical protein